MLILILLSYLQTTVAHVESQLHHKHHYEPKDEPLYVAAGPADYFGYAQTALDALSEVNLGRNSQNSARVVAGLKRLSGAMGVAGAVAGFFLDLFGGGAGPDPEILKLQEMVKELQNMIRDTQN